MRRQKIFYALATKIVRTPCALRNIVAALSVLCVLQIFFYFALQSKIDLDQEGNSHESVTSRQLHNDVFSATNPYGRPRNHAMSTVIDLLRVPSRPAYGNRCANRRIHLDEVVKRSIILARGVGDVKTCSSMCRDSSACAMWEWCDCKGGEWNCAGCYHFSAVHDTLLDYALPGQRVHFAAESGEECDLDTFGCMKSENTYFGIELNNRVLKGCPHLVISRYAYHVQQHNVHAVLNLPQVIDPIDPASIDAAELYDLGMMSGKHYNQFISAHRGRRIEVAGQFARLMTHARAWKACVEKWSDLPCVISEHPDLLNLRVMLGTTWLPADSSSRLILSDKSLVLFPRPSHLKPSSKLDTKSVVADSAAPSYLLAPRVARLLFQNLWPVYWDAEAQTLVSVGPTLRHKGLMVFVRAVCRAHRLACRIVNMQLRENVQETDLQFSHRPLLASSDHSTNVIKKNGDNFATSNTRGKKWSVRGTHLRDEEILLNVYCSSNQCSVSNVPAVGYLEQESSNCAIPRTIYTLVELADSVRTQIEKLGLSRDWSVVPLRDDFTSSSNPSALRKCVLQVYRSGGLCILSQSVVLPRNIADILDGLDTFVVHTLFGNGISPDILGAAPLRRSRSRLPPYPISADYTDEMYLEELAALSSVISSNIAVFARSVFYPEHLGLLVSAALLLNNIGNVPKIFHFIHLGTNDIAPLVKRTVSSWLRFHPNWQVKLWRDKDLPNVSKLIPLIRSVTKWAQKADILRMEVLYQYGGVYLDTDFEAFGRLDPWVESVPGAICNEVPITDLRTQRSISNGFFAIAKRHNLARRALVHLQSRSRLNTAWINQETGPFFFRNVLGEDVRALRVIPSHILFPVTFKERKNLQNWNCYEHGPCTSAILEIGRDVVGAHLWNRGGPGWSVKRHKGKRASPILDSLTTAILLHNSKISSKQDIL